MGSCINLNKGELKGKIENVKSKYILQKIFDNIIKDKTFKIVKYNKNIQNKININIDDYENYWIEKYKSIEIEIIPAKNKCGKFINIYDKDQYRYYHIYFNNNYNKQIKRNYLKKDENVTKINIIIDYRVKSFTRLFAECFCIEYISFKKDYRNNIGFLKEMFRDCPLKEANISNLNFRSLIWMEGMFRGCSHLKKVKLPHVNIKSINAIDMFRDCSSLEEINLSDFINYNIGYSYDIDGMFYNCSDELKKKIKEEIKDIDYKVFEFF